MSGTPGVLCPGLRQNGAVRIAELEAKLRSLGCGLELTDTAVITCTEWIADVFVDVATSLGDTRGAETLMASATDVLTQMVLVPAHDPAAPGPSPPPPTRALTAREHTVLEALQRRHTLRQIGASLFISRNTVKSHTRSVYRKLGVSSRAEAVARARELQLLSALPAPRENARHSSSSSRARRTAAERRVTSSLR